jgi:hypothetical protein
MLVRLEQVLPFLVQQQLLELLTSFYQGQL